MEPKKILTYLFVSLIGAAAIYLFFSARGERVRAREYERAWLAAEARLNTADEAAKKAIEAAQRQAAEAWGAVDSSNTVIARLEEEIEGRDRTLQSVRLEITKLEGEPRRIAEALDAAWAVKYDTLLQENEEYRKREREFLNIIAAKDVEIGALRSQIEARDKLLEVARESVEGLSQGLRRAERDVTVWKLAAGAALGLAGIGMLL